MPLEKPVLPLPRQPWSEFGTVYAGNAFVAFLFASSGPVAIILSVGARGGLSESDLASWIFAVFFLNGLITIAGRKTGIPRTTPIAIIEHEGRRWVWSPWGDVQWVRNLRAAGRATITVRRRRIDVAAKELDHAQRVAYFRDVLAPVAQGLPGGLRFIKIVDGVDLHVADGERLAIVGPSGSGKTTLIRLIAGLETPDAGTIEVDGRAVARDGATLVPTHRRRIGYVPQDGALFPHLSVGGNVGFGLPRGSDRTSRINELLEMVALDPAMAERRPHELSGGQQQRVALARAMGVDPAILLLDEPFSTLDAATRIEARDAVTRIVRGTGTTAVIVTHDRDDALAFADRTGTMAEGRLTWLGPSLDVAASMREGWCPTCGRSLGDMSVGSIAVGSQPAGLQDAPAPHIHALVDPA